MPGSTPQTWTNRTLVIDGQPVFVRHAPADAPRAVLVHGLGGSSDNWTDLVRAMPGELDAHAIDLPGFGRTPPQRGSRYGLNTHVAAVASFLEHLGEPAHVFGNSMGGAVAVRLAATRPDLVASLVLLSPALPVYRLQRGADPRLALMLVPGLAGAVKRQLRRTAPELRARRVLDYCVADLSRLPDDRIADAIAEATYRSTLPHANDALVGSLRGLIRAYLEVGSRGLWAQARSIRAPVLLMHGDSDRLVPIEVARRAAQTMPRARLVELPGVGHVPQMELPAVVADEVRRHLADVGVPAS